MRSGRARSGPLRIVFAGTPEFALPPLEALLESSHEVIAVYCQPDKPAGRGRRLTACPVKLRAQAAGIPLHQPQRLRDPAEIEALASLEPDLMVVVAFGQILPPRVLATPGLGCVNLHASLLPRWRGAAPIQRALLAGDTETGVCIMQLDAGLDTGPVHACRRQSIESGTTAGELHEQLSRVGAALLATVVDELANGRAQAHPQSSSGITYATKIDKREATIDWADSAAQIERQVLAFNPWPVAQTRWNGRSLRIWRARAAELGSNSKPGTVLSQSADGIHVACGEGAITLLEVQLPGGRPLGVAEFLHGHSLAGAVLQ